jgi:uncharacterized membrane protein YozB (DUF420 family)
MFFPQYAPTTSDWVLVAELAIGLTLLAGMFVVRAGHVRAHKYLQSAMVLVNVPLVLALMLPTYLKDVAPSLPSGLSQPFSYYPTAMLLLGIAAEALGIYIILVAGTSLIPERWRFRRYKLVMRTELILWWSVLLLGIATYSVWYT